ncbi:high mobility group B protein 7 [Lolium perenne]|uniref:high mobility group B protein 7 n=1 Tax=Lolium perenne TaxID=4522 RepID=UPI0021EA29FA|nr:high mobility group B protein 7 [Lolium perenne]
MASTGNAPRSRKRVEATVLKRARDGSAFTRCEACSKNVPVVLIDLHSCSLDSKIRSSLESQVVEKAVEVAAKAEKKRKSPSAAAGKGKKSKAGGDGAKKKRPQTAFFLFMSDFRAEFKAAHPDEKGVSAVGKAAGEKWRSMTEEEKKPYVDQAKELKAKFASGEGSAENNVGDEEKAEGDEEEVEEEEVVDEPEKEEEAEEEEEKNELDDDI